ncbi:prephenate dehydrogenase NovF [Streptomyces niveus]|uniref:prephenate dehydrogenase NovF n=1 Tax=Streptomyces niveus TaxID=193462 RepID=UPI0035D785FC
MRTAVIIGTGMIGTSIGLALRKQGVDSYLMDTSPVALRIAEAVGAGTAEEPPETVDLAVVAVPPAHVAPVIASHQSRGTARFYVDVAGVKVSTRRELDALGCDLATVVGGHPLVGRPGSGPLAARGDLFDGRPWALVPAVGTDAAALNRALELVAACGAIPVVLDAEAHDRAIALGTLVPQIALTLVAARLTEADSGALRLLGSVWSEIPQLVGVDSATSWTQVLAANAAPVVGELEKLSRDLASLLETLRGVADRGGSLAEPDGRLLEFIQRGIDGSNRVPGRYGIPTETALADVDVSVDDRPAELARLFDDVAGAGVVMRGIDISQRPDSPDRTVTISVTPRDAENLLHELRRRKWPANS